MAASALVYMVAAVAVWGTVTASLTDAPKVLDLSKGKYTRDDLKRSELLKHGDVAQWTEIDLSGNAIDEIDENTFLGFEKLEKLSLASNSLGTIEENWFRGSNLKTLDLSSNVIVAVRNGAFSGLDELRELNLANNLMKPFKHGTFDDTPNLKKITLENNPRAHWLFKNVTLPSLEELNMRRCRLTDLKMVNFENMPSLKKVDLEGNMIDKLDEGSLITNSKITDINLRDNAWYQFSGESLKKVFGPNTKVVIHFDYDDNRCLDCKLNSCVEDAELQRYLCDNPKNETSVYRGIYEWKEPTENVEVTLIAH